MATASVYFHRFYMFHSFLEFPRYVTATCALFLAGKAEETPKKCRDLIKTVRGLTNDHQFGTFGQVSLHQSGDLTSVEIHRDTVLLLIKIIMLLRQHPKPPTRSNSCLSLGNAGVSNTMIPPVIDALCACRYVNL